MKFLILVALTVCVIYFADRYDEEMQEENVEHATILWIMGLFATITWVNMVARL